MKQEPQQIITGGGFDDAFAHANQFSRRQLPVHPEDVVDIRPEPCRTRRVFDSGGYILSFVASRLDQAAIDLVKHKGFVAAPRRRPLHIIVSKKDGAPIPEMWPLSYLDTDYAYRF